MKDKPTYPTATMFDERYMQQRGHHLLVTHARKNGSPLYHVRHPTGTTLDILTDIHSAMKYARASGCHVYAMRADGQYPVAL